MDNPEITKTLAPYSDWVQRSQQILAPLVALGRIQSALDLGCNCGPWLAALNNLGVADVVGVNDMEIWDNILFDRRRAFVHDLATPLDLGRKFDLVICLEVAEHVGSGESGAAELMRTISRHGDTVLFSAATPGQEGDGHINCQPHEYWHERFSALGFKMWDIMRPFLSLRDEVETWYKTNMFLYTRRPPAPGAQGEAAPHTDLPAAQAKELPAPAAARRKLTLQDVHRFMNSAIGWARRGGKLIEQSEADRRAAICLRCEHNVEVEGCYGCSGIRNFVHGVVGDRQVKGEDQLQQCEICGCNNATKVWLPLDAIDNSALRYPHWCWQNEPVTDHDNSGAASP